MQKEHSGTITRLYQVVALLVLSCVILHYGRSLFIPLSYAIFISFLLQPVAVWFEKKGWGRDASIVAAMLLFLIVAGLIVSFIVSRIALFIHDWPVIKMSLIEMGNSLEQMLITKTEINPQLIHSWMIALRSGLSINPSPGMSATAINLGLGLIMIFLIPVYVYLILHYRQLLVESLTLLFPAGQRKQVYDVIRLSVSTYYGFIKGMILVYLIVGILNTCGLLILGIPHPIVFGFLTAVMTIIPYVGIVIAGAMPVVYAWIAFQSIWYPLGVIAVFTFVQYLEANIIFPWAVGRRLQLNTLVTLIVIIAGGIVWGASGMILFIPLAAILKLVADRLPGWEGLAKVLGN
ncbi:MAG TPA: AI-2E family transporter [Bacteroidia bacterium]|nr:AI-2E family transporter [Bacteroidia bacterium]